MPNASRGRRRTAGASISVSRRSIGPPPFPKAHFRVFIGGVEIHLESVSPLHSTDVEDTDVDVGQTVVLRRALGTDRRLFEWRAAVGRGKADRRDVAVVQLDRPDGTPVNIWVLEDAVPVRWSGPDFHARAGEFLYEELEVAYDSISWRSRIRVKEEDQ